MWHGFDSCDVPLHGPMLSIVCTELSIDGSLCGLHASGSENETQLTALALPVKK